MVHLLRPRSLVFAGALTLAAATSAFGQQTTPPPPEPPAAPANAIPSTVVPETFAKANPLKGEDVLQLKGTPVYDREDRRVGAISAVLAKPGTRTIDRLVIGEREAHGPDVAIPIGQFTWDAKKGVLKIPMSADRLAAMPAWKEQVSEGSAN